MRIFNPDGSESEMCGNGIRIFARYLEAAGAVAPVRSSSSRRWPVPSAPRLARRTGRCGWTWAGPGSRSANIDLRGAGAAAGARAWSTPALEATGRVYRFTFVDVGNPHCVIVVDDPAAIDLPAIGRGHRAASVVPQPGERGVHPPGGRRLGAHAGVGARRRGDPGLRHRGDGGGRGGGAAWVWRRAR